MNIGEAAVASGLPVKTLRYYEEIGLVLPGRCEGNDYRNYTAKDVEHLRFLRRLRAAGFGLDVCRELLELYLSPTQRGIEAQPQLLANIQQLDAQLQELQILKGVLVGMAQACAGDTATTEPPTGFKPSLMPFTLLGS